MHVGDGRVPALPHDFIANFIEDYTANILKHAGHLILAMCSIWDDELHLL